MSRRTSRPRAFPRDAKLSMRLPSTDRARLNEQARKAKRDASNLALEYLTRGMDAFDRAMAGQINGVTNGQIA